ncbi:unnamed protein product [Boreogadus saida]
MVIPTQPPLTATKKSTPKPPSSAAASSPGPRPAQPAPPPQPVAASYATASTPSQPTFNVQVRSAQPGPQHQAPGGPQHYAPQPQPGRAGPAQVQYVPAQPKGPDFAYGPPQPGFSPAGPGGYQDQQYPGPGGYQDQQYPGPGGYQEPQYPAPGGYQDQQYPGPGGYQDQQYPGPGQQNAWRPEPAAPAQAYQPPAPRKTFINDPPASLAPMYGDQPMGPPKNLCTPGPPLSINNGCVSADPPLRAPWPRSGFMSAALPDILVPEEECWLGTAVPSALELFMAADLPPDHVAAFRGHTKVLFSQGDVCSLTDSGGRMSPKEMGLHDNPLRSPSDGVCQSEKRFFVSREKENPDPERLSAFSAVFDIVGAHLTNGEVEV